MIKDDLNVFFKDYKNSRKFKTGDTVLYYQPDLMWVTAVILRKHYKTMADVAYIVDGEVMLDQYVDTSSLMKLPSYLSKAADDGVRYDPFPEVKARDWRKELEDYFEKAKENERNNRHPSPYGWPPQFPFSNSYIVPFYSNIDEEYPR